MKHYTPPIYMHTTGLAAPAIRNPLHLRTRIQTIDMALRLCA